MRNALPFDRWHKSYPKPHCGDVPCKCGTRSRPLYPSADHGRGLRWQARYVDHLGRERRVSFREWHNAHDHLSQHSSPGREERERGQAQRGRNVSFYATQMIRRKRSRGKRRSTVDLYEGHLRNHILPFAGCRPAASLRRSDSTAFVDHLLDTPSLRSPRSVVQVFKTWRILINYMMDEDVPLPVNTVLRIELPEVCCSTEMALTPDRVAAVAAAMRQIEPHYEIAVWLASCAGLRRGEALGLKWEHIDWERNLLCIREQQLRGQDAPLKTKASSAILPVDAFLIGQLARHLARFAPPGTESRLAHAKGRNGAAVEPGGPGLVVTNTHGQPVRLSHFYRRWHQALERAGLPPRTRFHQLKRFYTSTLAMSGEHDPKTVQLLSRHARFSETWDTYAQPPRTAAELRVNVFSSAFSEVK